MGWIAQQTNDAKKQFGNDDFGSTWFETKIIYTDALIIYITIQKGWKKNIIRCNLQTLFNIKSIPESTQLRTITDEVDSDYFCSFFDKYTHYLQRGKHLAQYQLLDELYYIPMDATDYFSSYACSCDRCLKTKSKKKPARDLSVEPTATELEELYLGEETSGIWVTDLEITPKNVEILECAC